MAKFNIPRDRNLYRPPIPEGIWECEITRVTTHDDDGSPLRGRHFGTELEGVLWQFTIVEDGDFKGRRLPRYFTPTEEEPDDYRRLLSDVLGLDPYEWDTDEVVGRKIMVEVTQSPAKDGSGRIFNNIRRVFAPSA